MERTLRTLVVGSGGREHALAWALARSASVVDVLVAPGNAGTSQPAGPQHAPIRRCELPDSSPESLVKLAQRERIELVVIGPEAPLCAGAVDVLTAAGIAAFGPTRHGAQLEGSKVFTKQFATRHDIPTARYGIFSEYADAEAYIAKQDEPVVVKADGLCGGKGAIMTESADEACQAAREMLVDGRFGEASRQIVVEERLPGVEMSVHALSDGERMLVLPVSRDHKRVGDGDTGLNTGGMGAFAPLSVDPLLMKRIETEVLRPTIEGMRAEGEPYRGVLYAGLMIAPDGTPNLLEHNVRFGDPECQVLMPLLDGDVAALLASAARGKLEPDHVTIAPDRHAVVLVLAAHGYPSGPRQGDAIRGLDEGGQLADTDLGPIFHAGSVRRDGQLLTAGGRVLGATGLGATLDTARTQAYRAAGQVSFDGMHYRQDIATSA